MTLEELKKEMIPFHNDICILYDTDLVRLWGVHQDAVDLYYYVRPFGTNKNAYYASAVGHITSLNGIYPSDRYSVMDNLFAMNGCQRTFDFSVTEDDTNPFEIAYSKADDLLSGLIWQEED